MTSVTTAVDRDEDRAADDAPDERTGSGTVNGTVDTPGTPGSHASTRPGHVRRRSHAVFAVFAVALGARLFGIRTAYNIFIDETTYTTIAHNLASGDGLTLFGQPFTLHPPVAFALLALFDRLTGSTGTPFDQQILMLRILPAVFGAMVVALGYAITARLATGWVVPVVVAVLLAFNPFQVYFDSRVLLEPFAGCFVAASVLLLLRATSGAHARTARRRLTVVGAALTAGLAFASKETFGLVWAVTLLVLLALPAVAPRATVWRVLVGGAAVYAAIIAVVWSVYGPATWWASHTSGLSRLVGTHQITGFNAASTKVTFTERLVANLGPYAVTYVLLAAGTVAALVVLVRHRVWRRRPRTVGERGVLVVALWTAAAAGYLAYATAFGSIEEQMYYIPLLPCTITLALLWDRHARSDGPRRALRRALPAAVALVTVAAVVVSAVVWVDQRRTDHNRYEQFLAWARLNLQDGVTIAVADDPAQFLVQRAVIGRWETPAAWRANGVDYVLVDSELVRQGYSLMDAPTLRMLQDTAPVAFSTTADDSTLYLFEVSAETGR